MNRQNITAVRDLIASLPDRKFAMDTWIADIADNAWGHPMTSEAALHSCNTAGCIGGWANALAMRSQERLFLNLPATAEWMGLTFEVGYDLFHPDIPGLHYNDRTITRTEAVMVLDHLLATGDVSWEIVAEARMAAAEPPAASEGFKDVAPVKHERVLEPA